MEECHLEFCDLGVYEKDPDGKFCILHSKDAEKDKKVFTEALNGCHTESAHNFHSVVFPDGTINFTNFHFTKPATFASATFLGEAHFDRFLFDKPVNFDKATFLGEAVFTFSIFRDAATFTGAIFKGKASFNQATFTGHTLFFPGFSEGNGPVDQIFSNVEVDFRGLVIADSASLIFSMADLSKCKFLNTDIRKIKFIEVKWPEIKDLYDKLPLLSENILWGWRFGVYDEIAAFNEKQPVPLSSLKSLYRQLKQNYEEQRDHASAGYFHYGEKEMLRKNPDTPKNQKFLLTIYCLFSGYGERVLRPLGWAFALLVGSTVGYMYWGIIPEGEGKTVLSPSEWWDWLKAAHYSFRVMTFLRPDDLTPLGLANGVKTLQSLLGPLLIGLFGLAVRQKMKR